MPLIHAVDLSNWANRNGARDTLGELLRRLIYEHIERSKIYNRRFLSHESNQLAGWDGILECDSEVLWIPSGNSVWELGTGARDRGKIRSDFDKRKTKELPDGWIRDETTYIAVTMRKLDDHSELITELKTNSPWRDVKVIDAAGFEEWIEVSPSVETWLQENGIGPNPTVRTLRKAWSEWSEITHPPVIKKLILSGRDQLALDLCNNLSNPGGPIHIQADSADEAIAFVYAAIDSTDDDLFKESLLSRSVVIGREEDVARFLQPSSSALNIILKYPATSKSLTLARFGHTVINAFGNSSSVRQIDFKLKRSHRSDFTAALSEMNMMKEKAEVEARACGCSPSIWRVWNLINSGDPGNNIPDWAKREHAELVIPAVLLGGWSEKSEGDKEIIKTLTGKDFELFRDQLKPLIACDNPLLEKAGDAWIISAPATAFALTIDFITEGQLNTLSTVTQIIFSEIDPSIELPPDDRPYAGLKNVRLKHSGWLRNGLAGSLLRIAVLGQRLENSGVIPNNLSCQQYVDSLIKALPGLQRDWRLLASLRDQLPVLMEAAPIPFIEALESLLQGQPEKVKPIFVEGEGMFGHVFHTGLLWGLETLAWEPKYLGRVGLILAGLAGIDPGGKMSNRPINSLREIFLAWHPGTSANLEQRLQAIDLIIRRNTEIGWELLCALMPKTGEISHPTHEPAWREFGRSNKETVTNKIVWEAYQAYVDRAISHSGNDPSRWIGLIEIYDDVADHHQKSIEEGLVRLANTGLNDDDLKLIWETLRRFINKHRGFPDAAWSLSPDKLDRLEIVKKHFESFEPADQAIWLFNDYFPDIPFPKLDMDKAQEELARLRKQAINEVWQKGQIALLREIIGVVSYPGLIAPILVDLLPDEVSLMDLVRDLVVGSDAERFFSRCLSGSAYIKFGDVWTKLLLTETSKLQLSPDEIANLFMNYPDSKELFTTIEGLGEAVKSAYWQKRNGWVSRDDNEILSYAIDEFLYNGRALDAIHVASGKWKVKEPNFYLSILDKALVELNEGKKGDTTGTVGYWIEELFGWLQQQDGVNKSELARREYAYLPLLTGAFNKKDLALHSFLAEDPKFYVQVICDIYKPTSGYPEDYEPSEEASARAKLGWQLLNSWKRPPGVGSDRTVNGESLRSWVEDARKLSAECDRLEISDQEIGKVLYYFPDDPDDGLWPHKELRDLLENVQNENIETGIALEQSNSRGVYSKAMFEGGTEERGFAQTWRERAECLGLRWPRTRALFERIAESWDVHAKWEDERAEKDRLRFR